ncbi:WD40-repeat-containing domain protein [Globomyces pollinis-pini]|nr:WD40-repeat-containing domain protein [Globomyces pollinis-pini]
MNVGSKTQNGLLFVDFNQDYSNGSCISVGTRTGYKIYTCEPFGKCYGKRGGGIGIAEMLFSTSLIALVGAGEHPSFSPRRLQIINTKRQSTICELTFATAVLGVKLNRKRLVVVLEEHIYVYDIGNMKLLHTIDTSPNPNALCTLSPSSENCYLAYPSNASTTLGELLIFDAVKLQAVNIIQAHKSPLSCFTFNFNGTILASASDKGTVIRVFSIPDGAQLFQFRRGTYTARIYCLSFSLNSKMLCVSSDSDTVHIYRCDHDKPQEEPLPSPVVPQRRVSGYLDTLRSPLASAAGAVGSILPSNITDIWEPQRHYAFAKIPTVSKDYANICGFNSGDHPTINVITADGYVYLYSIGGDGECSLLRQESIMDNDED